MFNLIVFFSSFSAFVWAGPKCTDLSKEEWVNQENFQAQLVKEGYKIKKFKVTKGNCYEIYGWNKDSEKIEIYFNPANSKIVKQKKW